jgi:hypothetical protein
MMAKLKKALLCYSRGSRPMMRNENGFSLLETIIAATMMLFMANGLIFTWQMAESRSRAIDQFTRGKMELEIAYEKTQRTLRSQARVDTLTLFNNGHGIRFTGVDGSSWIFEQSGANYLCTRNGVAEALIVDVCETVEFSVSEARVFFSIAIANPAAWTSETSDLSLSGRILIRNNE